MEYLILKWIHILSATLLFGTGLGSAFYKYMTDRSGNVAAMAQTNKIVVLADWLFTTPTIIIQPLSGFLLTRVLGFPLSSSWLVATYFLYVLAGACWLPVVVLQIRMRDLASRAITRNEALGPAYRRYMRIWFWLGVPAFIAMVLVYYLMVFKPVLWA